MVFNRLKELRESLNIRQTVIANYLHIKQGTYSDYKNGKINVPVENLIKIADYYKTSIDYLVGRSNERYPYKNNID